MLTWVLICGICHRLAASLRGSLRCCILRLLFWSTPAWCWNRRRSQPSTAGKDPPFSAVDIYKGNCKYKCNIIVDYYSYPHLTPPPFFGLLPICQCVMMGVAQRLLGIIGTTTTSHQQNVVWRKPFMWLKLITMSLLWQLKAKTIFWDLPWRTLISFYSLKYMCSVTDSDLKICRLKGSVSVLHPFSISRASVQWGEAGTL